MHYCRILVILLIAVLGLALVGCNSETNPNLPRSVGVHNDTSQPAWKITIDGNPVMRNLRPHEEWVVDGAYLTGSYHRFEIFTTDTTTSAYRGAFSVPWNRHYVCSSTDVAVFISFGTKGYTISE